MKHIKHVSKVTKPRLATFDSPITNKDDCFIGDDRINKAACLIGVKTKGSWAPPGG